MYKPQVFKVHFHPEMELLLLHLLRNHLTVWLSLLGQKMSEQVMLRLPFLDFGIHAHVLAVHWNSVFLCRRSQIHDVLAEKFGINLPNEVNHVHDVNKTCFICGSFHLQNGICSLFISFNSHCREFISQKANLIHSKVAFFFVELEPYSCICLSTLVRFSLCSFTEVPQTMISSTYTLAPCNTSRLVKTYNADMML